MRGRDSEFRVYGTKNGYREADADNPGEGFPPAVDTAGNGAELVSFRGKYVHPLYKKLKLRHERTQRLQRRAKRKEKFINRYFEK